MGCVDPSPFLNIIGRMFLAEFSSVKAVNFTLNFFYLAFNTIFVILRLASVNKIFIKVFFHILIIARASLLMIFYIIFFSVF